MSPTATACHTGLIVLREPPIGHQGAVTMERAVRRLVRRSRSFRGLAGPYKRPPVETRYAHEGPAAF